MPKATLKKMPSGLEFKVVSVGEKKRPYLIFRFEDHSKVRDKYRYHYFVEVEAKEAIAEIMGKLPKDVVDDDYNAAWNKVHSPANPRVKRQ